jgi:hypothetical protein
MKELLLIGGGFLGVAAIPAIKASIKAYRAKKAIGDVIVDGVEAAVEAVEKKKK